MSEVVGGNRIAVDLLGSASINPAALPDCPVAQVYRETLAGLLATKAASKLYQPADHTVLMIVWARSHGRRCRSAAVPARSGGRDDLSRSAARARRASESMAALRRIVTSEAEEHLGEAISLDLFATADNTLVPRFFALYTEPLAEGADALSQLDWGRSRCPHCGQLHRECAFAFPPRGLLAPFVAKARSDGLRGVIVVPFAPSDSAWPTHAAASRTSVVGQRDPCVIVPIRGSTRARATTSAGRSAWRSWLQAVEPALLRGRRCAVRPPSRVACVAAAPRRARCGGPAPRCRSAFAPRPTGPQAAARWPGLVGTRTGAVYASHPPV
jgi:hypothetical protein